MTNTENDERRAAIEVLTEAVEEIADLPFYETLARQNCLRKIGEHFAAIRHEADQEWSDRIHQRLAAAAAKENNKAG